MPSSSAQTSPTGTTSRGTGIGRLDAVLQDIITQRAVMRRVLDELHVSLFEAFNPGSNLGVDSGSHGAMPRLD